MGSIVEVGRRPAGEVGRLALGHVRETVNPAIVDGSAATVARDDGSRVKRYRTTIGSKSYVLAQGHPVDDLRSSVEAAVRAGGAFVDVVVYGNRRISVLVSPGLPFVIEESDLTDDSRDTGDVNEPFTLDDFDL